ncbi:hypothetical protein E4U41_002384 [Claviceps citrina]|nr:hypothetical protein E4U41_002384 [Claviceps citrina]
MSGPLASSHDLSPGPAKQSDRFASPRRSSCTVRFTPDTEHDGARLLPSASTTSVVLDRDDGGGICRSKACRQKVCRFYWLVICLVLLCETLLAGLAVVIRQKRALEPAESPPWLPPERSVQTIFQPDELYVGEERRETEEAWEALMPEGRGMVTVGPTTSLPALPKLDHSRTEQNAMVAVYHQLHCLYRTRTGYFAAAAGNISDMDLGHLGHCWDYLRQSIMCSADTTLEWLPPDEDGTTGWGYQHKCRDWSAVFDWTEQHRRADDDV